MELSTDNLLAIVVHNIQYVKQLLDSGHAYIAFDTPAELEAKRAEIPNFQYDARTRLQMRNSLTMPAEEVKKLLEAGEKYVVRFKVEPNEDVHVHDLIRGEVVINSNILGRYNDDDHLGM